MSKNQLQGPKNGCTNDQRVKNGYYSLTETTLIINEYSKVYILDKILAFVLVVLEIFWLFKLIWMFRQVDRKSVV